MKRKLQENHIFYEYKQMVEYLAFIPAYSRTCSLLNDYQVFDEL